MSHIVSAMLIFQRMHRLHTAQNQNIMPYVVHLCAMDTKGQSANNTLQSTPFRVLQTCLQHLHESLILKCCGHTLFVIKLLIDYGHARGIRYYHQRPDKTEPHGPACSLW
jgi:hypothetical protein